jgi:hypothetical protein
MDEDYSIIKLHLGVILIMLTVSYIFTESIVSSLVLTAVHIIGGFITYNEHEEEK